jgi:GAF domain-containing protein
MLVFMETDRLLLDHMRSVLETEESRQAKAQRISEMIRAAGAYRWVGIYAVESEEIACVAWSGHDAPAHLRFPRSQGLCGAAVRSGAAVVVGDVTSDPRYLATFGSTRSEIVVPMVNPVTGATLGLIDVESERVNAFTDDDRAFLEECASVLASLYG